MINAHEVLLVLHGLEAVDLHRLYFGVITEGSMVRVGAGGNVYEMSEPSFWPFERGEVLVLDKETGREPFGEGRKPAKWDVTCVYAETFADAMKIRNALPGLYERTDTPT